MSIITGFRANRWSNISVHEDTGIYVNGDLRECSMRPNQKHVFDQYGNERYFIMEEPAGAGKSTTIKFVCAKELLENPERKLIIAIPQTFISKSFGRVFLRYDDNSLIEWDIGKNLCQNSPNNRTHEIIKFLRKNKFNKGIEDRILITTHVALAKAFNIANDASGLFKNTRVVIDEAHHILYPENGLTECANKIGQLVQFLINENDPTTKIWLPTATFYRGDKGTIIPEEIMNQFTRYFLPLDTHWGNNIQHIKSFSFDFVVYKDSPFKEIKSLLKKEKKKTIIFCPYRGHLVNGNKYGFRDKLISEIRKIWPKANIIDLLDENDREDRKQIIYDDAKAKDIDIILSVKIFDEGSDWKFAERVIDLSPSNSLRVQGQRNGRLWRDCDGKSHIAYYMFLPFISRMLDEENYRRALSESYTAFIASLLIQEAIQPIPIPREHDIHNNINTPYFNWFIEEVPNVNKRSAIIGLVIKNLMFLKNGSVNPSIEQIKKCVETILIEADIKNHIDQIATQIVKMLRRAMVPDYKVDVSWMLEDGFDKIWKNDIFDRILSFGTGVAGIKTFEDFRKVWGENKTPKEWILIAERLARENFNSLNKNDMNFDIRSMDALLDKSIIDIINEKEMLLPSYFDLKKMGYGGLAQCMKDHPQEFEHIPQIYKGGKKPEEWVPIAEELAAKNNGKIPHVNWLLKNGYTGLVIAMDKFSDLFIHFEQDRYVGTSQEEWLVIAKKLAAENGGKIPSHKWLKENGYKGLSVCIINHRHLFEYASQDKHFKKPEEWVPIAKKLAAENGGKIPKGNWLRLNGYKGLLTCIRNHPELFSDLLQDKRIIMSEKEWVQMAKELAANNNGILPNVKWLQKNGYKGLDAFKRKHPELFSRFEQQKYFRTIEEWIVIAKNLAAGNGGKLPSSGWLKKNGYNGLIQCMWKHKDRFVDIQR